MDPGRTLRYCRRRAGLSQRQLAARLGLPQPAIARIESGRIAPRIDTLTRLIAACGFILTIRPEPGVDRSAIRELLALSPREKLELAAIEANNLEAIAAS